MKSFPVADWRELLHALCSDDPGAIGTVVPGEPLVRVEPTRFGWLTGLSWRPVSAGDFGFALLDLADPGAHPASAWDEVCGPLVPGPTTPGAGRALQGLFRQPGAVNRAAVYLTVAAGPDAPSAPVTGVSIRVEPA